MLSPSQPRTKEKNRQEHTPADQNPTPPQRSPLVASAYISVITSSRNAIFTGRWRRISARVRWKNWPTDSRSLQTTASLL